MKIKQRLGGDIEAVADGRGLAKFLLAGCFLFSVLAVYHFIAGAANTEQLRGSICATVFFLVVFFVTYEYSSFVFKKAARVVCWRRWSMFSRQSGRVAFDAVECVAAEAAVDHDPTTGGGLSRRLVLRTTSGGIPFTRAYTGDPDGELLRIKAQLNALFGSNPQAEILSSVRELVAAGRENDAVRIIRAERGISLKSAREEVRSIQFGTSDTQHLGFQGEPKSKIRDKAHHPAILPPEAMAALGRGNKIEAIKSVRVTYGLSLQEARDVVERYLQGF